MCFCFMIPIARFIGLSLASRDYLFSLAVLTNFYIAFLRSSNEEHQYSALHSMLLIRLTLLSFPLVVHQQVGIGSAGTAESEKAGACSTIILTSAVGGPDTVRLKFYTIHTPRSRI
ncbi:hypothetical protein BDW66DRAFT_49417 [Aspergillus desertorum]